jgi:hypothetical protein
MRKAIMGTDSLGKKTVQSTSQEVPALEQPYVTTNNSFAEKHYRVSDLAKLWGLGRETVRKLVKDDPGVVKVRQGRKKVHTTYSVPESAAKRIHTRLLNIA